MTLEECRTTAYLRYRPISRHQEVSVQWRGGEEGEKFLPRIKEFFTKLDRLYSWIGSYDWEVTTENNFPHSAGIASSASAFGALALCITTMAQKEGKELPYADFHRAASFLARIGSGSASRSVFPGWVLWGYFGDFPDSSDYFAIPVPDIHHNFRDLHDEILVISEAEKTVSSTKGHDLMNTHPYSEIRYREATNHTRELLHALKTGDWELFSGIVRREALSLHGLMMLSNPGYLLMKPGTVQAIEIIEETVRSKGWPLAWTLDAGPNVHLLYPGNISHDISVFIRERLAGLCPEKRIIKDRTGSGPRGEV